MYFPQIISFDEYIIRFKQLLKDLGMNHSVQKEYVLKTLFDNEGKHFSAEELLYEVKSKYKTRISIATIYRILSQLEQLRVVKSVSLESLSNKLYELNFSHHHDHMICLQCQLIIEFKETKLENLQLQIAKKYNFEIQSHSLLIYGVCEQCQKGKE